MKTVENQKIELPWDESDNPSFTIDDESSEAEPGSGFSDYPEEEDESQDAEQTEPGSDSAPADEAQVHRISFRMKADIKSTSSREQAAIAQRWEKAQNRLFLEDGFLTTVLEVMTKFNFEVRNAILTAVQRPTATRLATQASWHGLGVEIKKECLKNPVWLYAKEKSRRASRAYDISQTNGEEVYAVRRTIYYEKAVIQIAMSFLDELKIIYRDDADGIEYSAGQPDAFIAPTAPIRGFPNLLFEATRALAQRDMILAENMELTENTRYIAESAAFIVCNYFEMLPEKKRIRLPETIRSDEMHRVVSDLECARRIAQHYISTIRNRLRSKKWREGK